MTETLRPASDIRGLFVGLRLFESVVEMKLLWSVGEEMRGQQLSLAHAARKDIATAGGTGTLEGLRGGSGRVSGGV